VADTGKLERLVIHAYEQPDYKDPGGAIATFEAYVNPTEITATYEAEFESQNGAGTAGSRMEFKRMKPGDLSLAFFIDGTGANGRNVVVQEQIAKFQEVCGYSGQIHRPHHLEVAYGKVPPRRCVLKSASIAYKLFHPDGVPLRAVISAAFTESTDDATRVVRQGDQSADLTHLRLVKAGDTLPGLCELIYREPRMCIEVARVNGLDNFRRLEPGTRLRFPPFAK
jgi:hypothetical protein